MALRRNHENSEITLIFYQNKWMSSWTISKIPITNIHGGKMTSLTYDRCSLGWVGRSRESFCSTLLMHCLAALIGDRRLVSRLSGLCSLYKCCEQWRVDAHLCHFMSPLSYLSVWSAHGSTAPAKWPISVWAALFALSALSSVTYSTCVLLSTYTCT